MLFKYIYDKTADEDNQPDSLKNYCGVFDINLSITNMREIIEDAEQTYILPAIGADLWEELETVYDAYPGTALSANNAKLIRSLQGSIAYFTLFESLGNRGIFVSDMGPGQAVSKDGTFIFPSQWRTQVGMRKAFLTANRRLDRALQLLQAAPSDWPTWEASQAFTDSRELFFNSATELQPYLAMEASRVVYLALQPSLREAERRYIKPVLGEDFFDEIKAAILSGSLTSIQTKLIEHIRWALVKWMRICAIPNLRLRFNENNLVEPDMGMDASGKNETRADADAIRSLWVNDAFAAREFTDELKAFLWKNASSFTTFMESDLYDAETPPGAFLDEFNECGGGVGSLL